MGDNSNLKVFLFLIILTCVSAHRRYYGKNDKNAEIFDMQLWERVWYTWTNYLPACQMNCDRLQPEQTGLDNLLIVTFVPETGRCECYIEGQVGESNQPVTNHTPDALQLMGYSERRKPKDYLLFYLTEYDDVDCCARGRDSDGRTRTMQRKCAWLNSTSDGHLLIVRSSNDSSNCRNETLQTPCPYNGPCYISWISLETQDVEDAGTDDMAYFEAISKSGESCGIGMLEKENYNDKERGSVDVHDNIMVECDICLTNGFPVFHHVKATIDRRDSWLVEEIILEFNGTTAQYNNPNNMWLVKQHPLAFNLSKDDIASN